LIFFLLQAEKEKQEKKKLKQTNVMPNASASSMKDKFRGVVSKIINLTEL